MIPARLLVVTDRHGDARPLVETARAVLAGGARWIWFRDRDLARDARRALARDLLAIVRDVGGTLTIGGDADLAAEIGADGVHLGMAALGSAQPDPTTENTSTRSIGLSAHRLGDVRAARAHGLGYVTLSPIFPSPSKPGYGPALGLDGLRRAAGLGVPVVALGGIAPENARACLEAGAAGVAAMGEVMRASDPAAATRRLLAALGPAT